VAVDNGGGAEAEQSGRPGPRDDHLLADELASLLCSITAGSCLLPLPKGASSLKRG
jgi:hypothetical protein